MRSSRATPDASETHFIVSESDHAWLYSHRGDAAGPFRSRAEAIEAAIAEAVQTGNPAAEVIVLDHDLQQEIVWRYPDE